MRKHRLDSTEVQQPSPTPISYWQTHLVYVLCGLRQRDSPKSGNVLFGLVKYKKPNHNASQKRDLVARR
jgi:hypothetical protein